jgi:hypothetical protein
VRYSPGSRGNDPDDDDISPAQPMEPEEDSKVVSKHLRPRELFSALRANKSQQFSPSLTSALAPAIEIGTNFKDTQPGGI